VKLCVCVWNHPGRNLLKELGMCILVSFVSLMAYGQQPQTGATTPEKTVAVPDRPILNEPPFLRGEIDNSASAARPQSPETPGDLPTQLDNLTKLLGGRRGIIEIPPMAAPGWSRQWGASNVRYIDDRGNSLPNMWGDPNSETYNGFKSGWNNAILFRAKETDQAPSNRYTGFINMQFHYTAAKGGLNNYNGTSGTKTDYFNLMATSEMRTVGQKTGIASYLSSFSGGDTMGIQSYVTQYGGFDTNGDEQTEGIRIQAQQGSASSPGSGGIFEGVVSSIHGNTLSYTPEHDENTIGERRVIRDLDRSYKAGLILSIANSGGNPNAVTVTGSGTHWLQLGSNAHTRWNNLASGGGVTTTNLAFCFDPLKNDGYDVCFPVSAIIDDTHLTLNLLSSGPAQNTPWPSAWPVTGGYGIYAAAWPTSVDLAAHTFTAPDLSGIASKDRIEQVLAYDTQITGQLILMSRHIGLPGQGGGLNILNVGTTPSPKMEFGLSVSGGFESAISFQYSNQRSGPPDYFTAFYSDPGSGAIFNSSSVRSPASEVSLWRLRDSSGASHTMLRFQRDSATTCVLDSALCVSATGAVAGKQLDQVAANDYAGTITLSGGTTARVSFNQPFNSTPMCTLTPTSDPSAIGAYWVSATPSSITANVKQPGRISFTYICIGNPS
jgi:hypothetical protein